MIAFKQSMRHIARKLGFDVVRYRPEKHPLARRKKILDSYRVTLVIDVGANVGQYGKELRHIGYKGRIVSFEPLRSAFERLRECSEGDRSWAVYNFGLGDKDDTASINISGNSYSSSLLDMLPSHLKAAPASKYIGQEQIQLRTLDSIYPNLASDTDIVYLKIDTQGFEEHVLRGANDSLKLIDTLQLEMSLTPLYENEVLFEDMYQFLKRKGYQLIALEPGFTEDETGKLLQVDGIFHRM